MTTITAICIILYSLLTGWTRANFVGHMINVYERQTGKMIEVSDCPFTDSQDYPQACKAWVIEMTAGTSATTFSPEEKIEPYQAFLFVGRTLYALEKLEQEDFSFNPA